MRQEWGPNEESTFILLKIFILVDFFIFYFLFLFIFAHIVILSSISQGIPHILKAEMLILIV